MLCTVRAEGVARYVVGDEKDEVGTFTLYTAFGGVFAPRERDLESLATPYGKLGRARTPEEYDSRPKGGAWKVKGIDRSTKIKRNDASTW